MAIIPPLEDRNIDFRFYSFEDFYDFANSFYAYNTHYMVVAGNREIRNALTLDGVVLPDTGFVDIPIKAGVESLSIGCYKIGPGFHHLSCTDPDGKGATLVVYGGGDGFGYAYGLGEHTSGKSSVKATGQPTKTFQASNPYPNPCSGSAFTIPFFAAPGKIVELQVVDELGRIIFHEFSTATGVQQSFDVHLPIRHSGSFRIMVSCGVERQTALVQILD